MHSLLYLLDVFPCFQRCHAGRRCFHGAGDIMRCFGVYNSRRLGTSAKETNGLWVRVGHNEVKQPQNMFGASGTARWSQEGGETNGLPRLVDTSCEVGEKAVSG
jgi:hypothetical protein